MLNQISRRRQVGAGRGRCRAAFSPSPAATQPAACSCDQLGAKHACPIMHFEGSSTPANATRLSAGKSAAAARCAQAEASAAGADGWRLALLRTACTADSRCPVEKAPQRRPMLSMKACQAPALRQQADSPFRATPSLTVDQPASLQVAALPWPDVCGLWRDYVAAITDCLAAAGDAGSAAARRLARLLFETGATAAPGASPKNPKAQPGAARVASSSDWLPTPFMQ